MHEIIFILLFSSMLLDVLSHENLMNPLSDSFMDYVRRKQSSWKVGRNFPKDTSLHYLKALAGSQLDENKETLEEISHNGNRHIPLRFDSRNRWPRCVSIRSIVDQGSCESSWVVAPVRAMTDRYCIHNNATKSFDFSAQDVISCCDTCSFACQAGFPSAAWKYWERHGIVSGSFDSYDGCKPYSNDTCVATMDEDCNEQVKRVSCKRSCLDTMIDYDLDKKYAAEIYRVKPRVYDIQYEILTNGPVQATMAVYEDFLYYKSGVYRHVGGKLLGYHAVKIIGWGNDMEGNNYWLVANSWGPNWGDKGFFKIVSGENHCGIEDSVIAGKPKITHYYHQHFFFKK